MFAKFAITFVLQISILFGLVMFKACGSAGSFANLLRVTIAAGAPILNVFVQQGKIDAVFKDNLIGDLNQEATHVTQLTTCFDAITEPKEKPKHLQCIQTFESQTRVVLQRHFKTNQTVAYIADDIEAVIQAAIIFYGGGSGVTPGSHPMTESEIKARVQKLKKDLGQ